MGHSRDIRDKHEFDAGLGSYGRLANRIDLGVDLDDFGPAAEFRQAG